MKPEDLKEHLEEMFNGLYLLPRELWEDIDGFAISLKVGEKIGVCCSKSLLDLTVEEKCNIVCHLAFRLEITPDTFINFIKDKSIDMLNGFSQLIGGSI